jgi:hypothetical protein
MKSKKPKISKKNIFKSKARKIYPDTPRILLWFIVLIIVFILSTLSIFWLRAPNLLIRPEVTKTPEGPVWGEFLTFQGPDGFTFDYPDWSQVKIEDLPKNSFPEEIKLLLMETDNKFMQFMALETSADLAKDLKTLISEDLKRESEKVRDLKVVRQEIKDNEALLELTYFTDGFMVRMFSRDFLVKGEKENKVYSLAVQLVDSKLGQYENIQKKIINSAKIVAQ